MITMFFNSIKLIRSITIGIKEDEDFRILLFILLVLIISATTFYMNAEGWGVIDSLYFSVMTMSTIGYGDMVPSNSYSKIFTIIFAFLGVGVFASIISKIVAINLDRHKKILQAKSTNKTDKAR